MRRHGYGAPSRREASNDLDVRRPREGMERRSVRERDGMRGNGEEQVLSPVSGCLCAHGDD